MRRGLLAAAIVPVMLAARCLDSQSDRISANELRREMAIPFKPLRSFAVKATRLLRF